MKKAVQNYSSLLQRLRHGYHALPLAVFLLDTLGGGADSLHLPLRCLVWWSIVLAVVVPRVLSAV